MGRRKDRMLAAMSNAGRRVKLDLSVEPSGDLGGSSGQDEVGKDMETKEHAGLPKSPTSSGQPQNPLLLLGQYSDDEIDDESPDKLKKTAVGNPSSDDSSQGTKGPVEKNAISGQGQAPQEVKLPDNNGNITSADGFQKPEVHDTKDNEAATSSHHLQQEMNLEDQTSVAETSATQLLGDVSLGWKMVLHEESNQYYYWNPETGETSWDVPPGLAQITDATLDKKTTINESMQTAAVASQELVSAAHRSDDLIDHGMISQSTPAYECALQIEDKVEGRIHGDLGNEDGPSDVSQTEFNEAGGAAGASFGDNRKMHMDSLSNEESELAVDFSSKLERRSELLLEKLKSLEVSKGHDWTSTYVLEVQIRLSDIKSLSCHGSSLLPFWLHSERQLQRLEGAIDEKIYQIAKSQVDEVMATHMTSSIEDKSLQGEELQNDGNRDNTIPPVSSISNVSSNVDELVVVSEHVRNEPVYGTAVNAENFAASSSQVEHLHSDSIAVAQVNGPPIPEDVPKPMFHDGDDVDMDVDMEVEDASPAGNASVGDISGTIDFTSQEKQIQPNPPVVYPSLPSDDPSFVPPPPDEEWIPPPPPDNEQVPPPPPDEPPVPSYTSTSAYMETGQPVPYTVPYNAFTNPGFTYYGPTVPEVPGSSFYVHADGTQVNASHASVYYGVVPSTYNGTAPVVNPVSSVTYYGHQDVTIPSQTVASSIGSSQNYNGTVQAKESNLASGRIGPMDALPEEGEIVNADISTVGGQTDSVSQAVPSTSEAAQATSNTMGNDSDSVKSGNVPDVIASAAANAMASTTKAQSKVRNKKRTVAVAPTLRSNKKVSSLVDKWKAAKEELNESEEEEPENAYEILERKRQREIEEWRAQQIASGEAKDNANFQPLGGDWREKVKRRRAEAAKEAAKSSPDTATTKTTNASTKTKPEAKKPSLVELSRNLPTGWQAYWDETSKQVYYGNTITSETTWTRPTR